MKLNGLQNVCIMSAVRNGYVLDAHSFGVKPNIDMYWTRELLHSLISRGLLEPTTCFGKCAPTKKAIDLHKNLIADIDVKLASEVSEPLS